MFYYFLSWGALFVAFISFTATGSIKETIQVTAALVGLTIITKWLFFSDNQNKPKPQFQQPQPQAPQPQSQKIKPAQEKTTQQKPAKKQPHHPTPNTTHEWPEIGEYEFEVVGESHYQHTIRQLAGDHDEYGAQTECIAALIPENTNPYDNKAVRVDINGMTVGYLNKFDARSFRRRLGTKKLTGQTTTCGALIKGGFTMKDGQIAHYGVALDLKLFE